MLIYLLDAPSRCVNFDSLRQDHTARGFGADFDGGYESALLGTAPGQFAANEWSAVTEYVTHDHKRVYVNDRLGTCIWWQRDNRCFKTIDLNLRLL